MRNGSLTIKLNYLTPLQVRVDNHGGEDTAELDRLTKWLWDHHIPWRNSQFNYMPQITFTFPDEATKLLFKLSF